MRARLAFMRSSASTLSAVAALAAVAVLHVAYTVLEFAQPGEPLYAIFGLAIACVGVAVLRAAGLSREQLRLRRAPLSRVGAGMLAAATLLLLPILGSNSGFLGWRWLPAVVYAPASGITQELFFRGTLLPGLERMMPSRPGTALLIHCALFVAWHLRTFTFVASLPLAFLVATVLFLAGLAWGRQVQHDGTILWSAAQHSLFLVVMSLFDWG
jgi:membrane protease YdiL (CAAX protease family)